MSIKVLVVDNNPVHLKGVSAILEKEGCQVRTAVNGLVALEEIEKDIPEIVITDLVMPLLDGEKLCKILRAVEGYKNIFLVVLSALLAEDQERITKEIDCDIYIGKGTLNEIRSHVFDALKKYKNRELNDTRVLGIADSEDIENLSVTQELLSEKKHLQRVLENLSEGILELSNDGRIVYMNDAASLSWDIRKEEILGQEVTELDWGDKESLVKGWIANDLIGVSKEPLEIREDSPIQIGEKILTASFLVISRDAAHFGLCIIRDITRQYKAEKRKEEIDNAIKLVKKMDAMSCMAGGVAHDFNNLLTVICGSLDMISRTNALGEYPKELELLENSRNSAHSAVELVRKISHFSPYGIVTRRKRNLGEFVDETVNNFFLEKEFEDYKFIGSEKDISVNIDPYQIRIAVQNVLQNSIEANLDGLIEVLVAEESLPKPDIRSGQYIAQGNYGVIKVTDRGVGIAKENLQAVFDPYYSTKVRGSHKGMGLGLTIVYATIRNHGGYVVVESEEKQGATVTLLLPKVNDRKHEKKKEGETTIMLVGGDVDLRSICKIMLEYLNYRVIEADGRADAIEKVKGTSSTVEKIDIAIVNLSEEGKRTGVEICSALHRIDSGIKVVVSSGSAFDPVMKGYLDFGFSATLVKPYTLDDLKKLLWSLEG